MSVKIIKSPITRAELRRMAQERFGDMVKGAVDIERGIMAIGGELHIDEEVVLIENEDARQNNVWGINLYPDKTGEDFIEYDSMINIKPNFGNRTRGIEDAQVKEKIKNIVGKLVK